MLDTTLMPSAREVLNDFKAERFSIFYHSLDQSVNDCEFKLQPSGTSVTATKTSLQPTEDLIHFMGSTLALRITTFTTNISINRGRPDTISDSMRKY